MQYNAKIIREDYQKVVVFFVQIKVMKKNFMTFIMSPAEVFYGIAGCVALFKVLFSIGHYAGRLTKCCFNKNQVCSTVFY